MNPNSIVSRAFCKRIFFSVVFATQLVAGAQFYGVNEPVMGTYEGFWTAPDGHKGRVSAQIRALGDGAYDGFVTLHRAKAMVAALKLTPTGGPSKDAIHFAGVAANPQAEGDLLPAIEGKAQIQEGKLTGTFSGELGSGSFEANRIVQTSPTLGAQPPKGALVIFDGKDSGKWDSHAWKLTGDGAMQAQKGDLRAKDKFTNFKLHLEFRTPFMPKAQGQDRGNSGVFLQSKYEVQVLDSFGVFPLHDDDCAGIYKVKAPSVNACFPPMQWQTYDIIFVQGNPAKGERPMVTIVQNGITVIDQAGIPANMVAEGTGGGEASGGFLKLQDHGCPVEYRNIWVEPFFSRLRMGID